MNQQWLFLVLLATAILWFILGRWRYDLTALVVLLVSVATGLVPPATAFDGFGDPAVITVAAVLVLSRGLHRAGVVDRISSAIVRPGAPVFVHTLVLTALVAVLSAFMNNVGALALVLPVVVQLARRDGISPSLLLMPLAFGSLLGGMVTLIGTPPNIIISDFRSEVTGQAFAMFDFLPVGLGVAVVGALFVCVFGRHLVPHRVPAVAESEWFHMNDYVSEVRLTAGSPFAGQSLRDVGWATDAEMLVLALIRGGQPIPAPSSSTVLVQGDVLVVEADPQTLRLLSHAAGLELVGSREGWSGTVDSDEVAVVEAVVGAHSTLVRQTARSAHLRRHHGINLLGVARAGRRLADRLGNIFFQPGDVVLLQGPSGNMGETLRGLGCLLLAGPGIRFEPRQGAALSVLIFGAAVAITAFEVTPVQVAFAGAAAAMVGAGILSLKEAYESIDWSVIVLLGAMLPVGKALETSGAVHTLATGLVNLAGQVHPWLLVGGVLLCSMLVSNVLNNAATAVLMAPVAVGTASQLAVCPDPFLMAVAVGSTAAFLTPIGHQSNTLVMGPGGYSFGDYWRLGLPLSILVLAVALPLILWWWPPQPAVG